MKRILIAVLIGLCGCRSTPQVRLHPAPRPEPVDARIADVVRAYHLGRYVDPTGAMHDGHTMYRVEMESRWDLRPTATRWSAGAPDPAYSPPPLNDLVIAELRRQQEVTERVMREASQLADSHDALQQLIAYMTRVAREHGLFTSRVQHSEERLSRLEGRIRAQESPGPDQQPQTHHDDEKE